MRRPVLLALLLLLPSCAASPVKPQLTIACPASLTADTPAEPKIPDGASIPAAQTDPETMALQAYLGWLSGFTSWAHGLASRADQARTWCAGQK